MVLNNAHIFQGAKYVSDFSQCIGDIEKDLRAGKWVLVSGTPCQIYGIKKYIQKKQLDSKLFTIDLLCHGTAKKSGLERLYCMVGKK